MYAKCTLVIMCTIIQANIISYPYETVGLLQINPEK